MAIKNILIAGGSGLVGGSIAANALKRKINVISLSRGLTPQNCNPKIQNIKCDMINSSEVDSKINEVTDKIDAAVYAVGSFSALLPAIFRKKGVSLENLNYLGAINMARSVSKIAKAKNKIIPFVYISGKGVTSVKIPFPEYQRTKLKAEKELKEISGLSVLIIRPAVVVDETTNNMFKDSSMITPKQKMAKKILDLIISGYDRNAIFEGDDLKK